MDPKVIKELRSILKEELREQEKRLVTKDDAKHFATKDDLNKFATKDDLQQVKRELMEYTDKWCTDIIASVDKNKADKDDAISLTKRIVKIEETLAS